MTEETALIEVDIGGALAALQASPELCARMNELIGGPALAAAYAQIDRMKAERLKLDKRIHNQRRSNRENWEIVERRAQFIGNAGARKTLLRHIRYWRDERAKVKQLREVLALAARLPTMRLLRAGATPSTNSHSTRLAPKA